MVSDGGRRLELSEYIPVTASTATYSTVKCEHYADAHVH